MRNVRVVVLAHCPTVPIADCLERGYKAPNSINLISNWKNSMEARVGNFPTLKIKGKTGGTYLTDTSI